MSPENPRAVLAREALRLHQRYQREVIERFSICPWAKPARSTDRIRSHVIVDATLEPGDLRTVVEGWARDEEVEVAFLIAPRFAAGSEAFSRWTQEVGVLRSDVFFAAPFHPNVPHSAGTIRFLRQAPDPTAQLVRRTRLDAIRRDDPPHYKDIFDLDLRDLAVGAPPRTAAATVRAHNDRLIEREGKTLLRSIIGDIRADRDRTYARILTAL